VSEATRITAQALYNHRGKGNKIKQMSFKPGPEDWYGRYGSDKIWQTVPDTCSCDRESSVTNSRKSGAANK